MIYCNRVQFGCLYLPQGHNFKSTVWLWSTDEYVFVIFWAKVHLTDWEVLDFSFRSSKVLKVWWMATNSWVLFWDFYSYLLCPINGYQFLSFILRYLFLFAVCYKWLPILEFYSEIFILICCETNGDIQYTIMVMFCVYRWCGEQEKWDLLCDIKPLS